MKAVGRCLKMLTAALEALEELVSARRALPSGWALRQRRWREVRTRYLPPSGWVGEVFALRCEQLFRGCFELLLKTSDLQDVSIKTSGGRNKMPIKHMAGCVFSAGKQPEEAGQPACLGLEYKGPCFELLVRTPLSVLHACKQEEENNRTDRWK